MNSAYPPRLAKRLARAILIATRLSSVARTPGATLTIPGAELPAPGHGQGPLTPHHERTTWSSHPTTSIGASTPTGAHSRGWLVASDASSRPARFAPVASMRPRARSWVVLDAVGRFHRLQCAVPLASAA